MRPELRETWTPAINVLTWYMLVTSILSVLTRIGTKYGIFRKLTVDDHFSIASVVLCTGQSIAVSIATAAGLGQHLSTISDTDRQSMMKAQYASDVLFILSICCSKLAIMLFIRNLTPASLDRRIALGLGISVVIWTVVGVFTALFQCKLPNTWDYMDGQCFDRNAWWNYLGVTDIATEAGIITQALLVVIRVQADIHKKAVLGGVFCLRVIVVIAIICQLYYASQTKASTDVSWDRWTVVVSTQMTQALSIITSCSPQFKPFLDSLQSTGMSLTGSSGHGSKTRTYAYGTTHKSSRGGRMKDARSDIYELVTRPGQNATRTLITSTTDCDAESQSSETKIIRETRTWTITETRQD